LFYLWTYKLSPLRAVCNSSEEKFRAEFDRVNAGMEEFNAKMKTITASREEKSKKHKKIVK